MNASGHETAPDHESDVAGSRAAPSGAFTASPTFALRIGVDGGTRIELYNLAEDVWETKNLAHEYPDLVERMKSFMDEAHTPSSLFPLTFPGE